MRKGSFRVVAIKPGRLHCVRGNYGRVQSAGHWQHSYLIFSRRTLADSTGSGSYGGQGGGANEANLANLQGADIQKRRPYPNVVTMCKENRIAEAFVAYKRRPTPYGASALISTLGRQRHSDSLDHAFAVYETLTAAHSHHLPNMVVINALINTCRQCGHPGRALPRLLDDVERFGLQLDALAFHLLTAACGEAGDRETAKRLVAKLRGGHLDFTPDAVDCAQLIKALLIHTEATTRDHDHHLEASSDAVMGRESARLSSSGGKASLSPADAVSVLEVMDERGIAPNRGCFALLLPACGESGDLALARRLHARICNSKIAGDPLLASRLIVMYAKCGSLDDAVASYERLIAGGHRPDVAVISALINACRHCGQPGRVLPRLLDDLEQFGVPLDALAFHLLTTACGEAGDKEAAKRLVAMMCGRSRLGFVPSTVDCRQLLKALLSTSPLETASEIQANSSCSLADALNLLDTMDKLGIPPDDQLFTALLSGCADRGDIHVGRRLHARILSSRGPANLVNNDFVVAGLVSMYARCGFLDEATAVFADMRWSKQLPPTTTYSISDRDPGVQTAALSANVSAWTAMLSAYGQHGRGREALALFEEMAQGGGQPGTPLPNAISLIAVLNACSHAGLVDEALAIFHSLVAGRYGMTVEADIRHQNCLVDVLGRAGRLDEAEQFIETHISQPDAVTWKTLLGACRSHHDVARAEHVIERMHALAAPVPANQGIISLDAASRVLLANTYARAGRWDDSERVRQQMKNDGVRKVPGVSWITVDGMQHVFTVEDKQHPKVNAIRAELDHLWQQMKAGGFVPNRSVVTARWLADGADDEAKDCHLQQHSEKLAIAFGLLATPKGTPLRVFKNLRVCANCHEATKFIARLSQREIIVRDANRFHHFTTDGFCSCCDYW